MLNAKKKREMMMERRGIKDVFFVCKRALEMIYIAITYTVAWKRTRHDEYQPGKEEQKKNVANDAHMKLN